MPTKTSQYVMTQGVEARIEQADVYRIFLRATALHTDSNYFLVIKPTDKGAEISDGNGNVFSVESEIKIKSKLYCIRDDYGHEYVTTLLLPEEY
jgi:hypothetical protein